MINDVMLCIMMLRLRRTDVMFAIKCADGAHHQRSGIIGRSPASFAEGKHHAKNPDLSGGQIRIFAV